MSIHESIIHGFAGKKVLIAGDVMIDRYLNGNVNRISPEAPVPIVQLTSIDDRLGGAGNVALNIKAFNAIPVLLSVVGNDENGSKFSKLLEQLDIESQYLLKSDHRRTTVKTRVVSSNQQMLRVDSEDTFDLTEFEKSEVILIYKNILNEVKPDVIILQDYNKGFFTPDLINEMVAFARNHNIPVTVDPKRKNFLDFKDVTLFKPNLKEVREALNYEFKINLDDLVLASAKIKESLNNKITFITLSENGLFIDDGVIPKIYPTTPRNVSDVCGAGDTVISTISLGIAAGLSSIELSVLANIAGGQVCERPGVVPVDLEQLKKELLEISINQESL